MTPPWAGFGIAARAKHAWLSQLFTRLEAGMGMAESLHPEGMENTTRLAAATRRLADTVQAGGTLTQAVASTPELFQEHERALVEIGEEHGQLTEALRAIEASSRWLSGLRRKVSIALIYPFFLLNVAHLCLNVTMVLDGRLWAYLGGWLWLDIQLGLLCFAALASRRFEPTRQLVDRAVLQAPVVSWIFARPVLRHQQARFFSLLGGALDAGASSQRAMELAVATVGNHHVQRDLERALEGLRRGESWGQAFTHTRTTTPAQRAMLLTAELSGALPRTLELLAGDARGDLEHWIRIFYTVVPTVLLVLAIFAIAMGGP